MKDFVSEHRIIIAASISMLLLGWGVVASPGGSWPGIMSMAALAALLVTCTALLFISRFREPSASMAQVIQDVSVETAAIPSADWKGKAIL